MTIQSLPKSNICKECGQKIRKQRTIPQNNSYWGLLVTPLAEYLSLTTDECHNLLKYKFNSEVVFVKTKDGKVEEVRKIKSTTKQTTSENMEYQANCRMWASQLGLSLKEPNEVDYA